jgi:hypothetical protein
MAPRSAAAVESMFTENALSRAGGGARSTIRQMIYDGRLQAIVIEANGRRRFLIPATAGRALIARKARERSAA